MEWFSGKVFSNARAIIFAVVVHVIAIGILLVNVDWDIERAAITKSAPVQTQVVDKKLIDAELKRLELEKQQKLAEQRVKAEQKRKRELAEKRRKVAERKKAEEVKRKKLLAEKKQRELVLKRKQEEKQRLQRELAAKKKAEAAARKKKLAEEAKQKRIAEEQQRRRQKELLQALAEEENASRVQQLKALIQADVQNHWLIPSTARRGMECLLRIKLLPNGDVQSVRILRSSGNGTFDRSVEDAVRKASPLPVSVSSAGHLFNSKFREFDFRFIPVRL